VLAAPGTGQALGGLAEAADHRVGIQSGLGHEGRGDDGRRPGRRQIVGRERELARGALHEIDLGRAPLEFGDAQWVHLQAQHQLATHEPEHGRIDEGLQRTDLGGRGHHGHLGLVGPQAQHVGQGAVTGLRLPRQAQYQAGHACAALGHGIDLPGRAHVGTRAGIGLWVVALDHVAAHHDQGGQPQCRDDQGDDHPQLVHAWRPVQFL